MEPDGSMILLFYFDITYNLPNLPTRYSVEPVIPIS